MFMCTTGVILAPVSHLTFVSSVLMLIMSLGIPLKGINRCLHTRGRQKKGDYSNCDRLMMCLIRKVCYYVH